MMEKPSHELRVLALPLYGTLAASTRHRISYFKPGLMDHGIEVDVAPLLDNNYLTNRFGSGSIHFGSVAGGYWRRLLTFIRQRKYDCVWVQGELSPLVPGWIEAALLSAPFVFDFDDAFPLKYRLAGGIKAKILGNKFAPVLRKAAISVPGNKVLAEMAKGLAQDIRIVPTVVDHTRYLPAIGSGGNGYFNVGWIGSPSSIRCLRLVEDALAQLAQESPVRLTVVGGVAPAVPGVEVVNIPWSEDTEVDLIRTFDVGIMPLEDDPWTRGKCAFKLIQYMACGVPAIGSPVGANIEVLDDGAGLLANGTGQWLASLRALRDDPALGARMGTVGRAKVAAQYSLASQLPVYEQILRDAANKAQ